MFQTSRRVDYALRAAVYLASLPEGDVVSFRDIAANQCVPKDFLAKILRDLGDANLVRSVRGAHGGFALARPAREISFLDVIRAAEGQVALNKCCDSGAGCRHMQRCGMKTVWQLGEAAMFDVFAKTSLADIVAMQPAPRLAQLAAEGEGAVFEGTVCCNATSRETGGSGDAPPCSYGLDESPSPAEGAAGELRTQ